MASDGLAVVPVEGERFWSPWLPRGRAPRRVLGREEEALLSLVFYGRVAVV